MSMDSTIGRPLHFSGDVGSAAAAAGWKGTAEAVRRGANGVAEEYAGSLFQQLIIQMLTANGQAADAANGAAGGDAPGAASDSGGGTLAEMFLTGDNGSETGLLYETTGENVPVEGSYLQGGTGSPAIPSGGQPDELQVLMTAMTGLTPVLNSAQITVGSQAEYGSEAISAAAGNDAGMPAGLEALFMNGGNAEVPAGTAVPQEITAEGVVRTTGAYDSGGKASIAAHAGQVSSGGNSGIPVSAETVSDAAANSSRTEQSVSNAVTTQRQDGRTAEAFGGLQPTDAESESSDAAWKSDKAFGEAAADTGRIPQEAQNLQNVVQTRAAEQNPDSPFVNRAEPYSQIRDEILAKLEQKGPSEFKMQLEPAELGQIDIKFKLSEGKLIIDILAASAKTQALLTSQVDKLIASLGLQNVQVESVQVGQQANAQGQDGSQGQGYQTNAGMDFSQRRQQDRLQDEVFKGGSLNGMHGLQQQEARDSGPAGRIEAFRYGSYRMDYIV